VAKETTEAEVGAQGRVEEVILSLREANEKSAETLRERGEKSDELLKGLLEKVGKLEEERDDVVEKLGESERKVREAEKLKNSSRRKEMPAPAKRKSENMHPNISTRVEPGANLLKPTQASEGHSDRRRKSLLSIPTLPTAKRRVSWGAAGSTSAK
tara:strand:+ start:504 stop:971 length:468 start_codon:yes stop_codon:yes gene_type:complete